MKYDVFVSYNSKDQDLAQQIAEELKNTGLKVWFDKWELRPGVTWQDGLNKGIKESNSTIILIGQSGIGDWVSEEVRSALQRYVKHGCPVIPVILPGVEKLEDIKLPPFLDQRTWVDCRTMQISQQSLDRLIWGIIGRRPTRLISQIGDEFCLMLPRSSTGERCIKIYTLPNPDTDKLLDVTWETFGKGIENLHDQIKNYGHHLNLDACFGINDAGLIMATFLNSSALDRVNIGYVRTNKGSEGIAILEDDSFFPVLPSKPTIMLMDFEVKSGNGLKMIIERFREKYIEPNIYFAVFGALTNKPNLKISSFDELVPADKLSKLNINNFFIACTMHLPGIEPPLGLR